MITSVAHSISGSNAMRNDAQDDQSRYIAKELGEVPDLLRQQNASSFRVVRGVEAETAAFLAQQAKMG
jgi:hypothetical protein